MEVFIIVATGYEDGECDIEGVFTNYKTAKAALKKLETNMCPEDKEWLFYTLKKAKVIENN